ncbi:hypothetical protein Poly59_40900 [Rubripirellula reticaptiva]|uniref:MurG-like transferase n=1 Tax=Rubripirellula reticaptiva TaxID=2528013 RepID=A0A5C6ELV7_9BACT|nr:hypothetical protein Poly59_40900 [Rubripirellula reticaptiva]
MTWELGSGLGHLLPLRVLSEQLVTAGHEVALVCRGASQLDQSLIAGPFTIIDAPVFSSTEDSGYREASNFAHTLMDDGFLVAGELAERCQLWRNLFDELKPDCVLFDHSPIALLAAQGLGFATATLGTGFCCPPDAERLPNWRPWLDRTDDECHAAEQLVTANINHALCLFEQPEIRTIGELYYRVDRQFHQTYPELDHFPDRIGANYVGIVPVDGGEMPKWPLSLGKRIFAYLKQSPWAEKVIKNLAMLGMPTLVYGPTLDAGVVEFYETNYPAISFARSPLCIEHVTKQCDIAVHHGTHGVSAAVLLAGKPSVLFPIALEQRITCVNIHKMGAGRLANPFREAEVLDAIHDVLVNESYLRNAACFAEQYRTWDLFERLMSVAQWISEAASAHAAQHS